jgi:uncharacterized membrane protein YraQ (UPF0718 family)
MLFNIVCVLLCGILIGLIIGFMLCRPVIRQRMLEVENYWKQKVVKTGQEWKDFHNTALDKWQKQTNVLINKTYHAAIAERDKAWEQKFKGTKLKPKPPSN